MQQLIIGVVLGMILGISYPVHADWGNDPELVGNFIPDHWGLAEPRMPQSLRELGSSDEDIGQYIVKNTVPMIWYTRTLPDGTAIMASPGNPSFMFDAPVGLTQAQAMEKSKQQDPQWWANQLLLAERQAEDDHRNRKEIATLIASLAVVLILLNGTALYISKRRWGMILRYVWRLARQHGLLGVAILFVGLGAQERYFSWFWYIAAMLFVVWIVLQLKSRAEGSAR